MESNVKHLSKWLHYTKWNIFTYLGSNITENAECEMEIQLRINNSQAVWKTLQNIR